VARPGDSVPKNYCHSNDAWRISRCSCRWPSVKQATCLPKFTGPSRVPLLTAGAVRGAQLDWRLSQEAVEEDALEEEARVPQR